MTERKATRTNKSFIGVLWGAWSDGVVAHWVELIALEVEAAISSFTDLGPPQTQFTHSCVGPYRGPLGVPAVRCPTQNAQRAFHREEWSGCRDRSRCRSCRTVGMK